MSYEHEQTANSTCSLHLVWLSQELEPPPPKAVARPPPKLRRGCQGCRLQLWLNPPDPYPAPVPQGTAISTSPIFSRSAYSPSPLRTGHHARGRPPSSYADKDPAGMSFAGQGYFKMLFLARKTLCETIQDEKLIKSFCSEWPCRLFSKGKGRYL